MRRFSLASVVAALSLAASASSAAASVTIGQTATPSATSCSSDFDRLHPTPTSGNSYVVPDAGGITSWTVTSWSTIANATGGLLTMKVYRPLGGTMYMVVGHDGPRALAGGVLNTFAVSLAVKPGDVLGISTPPVADSPGCIFDVPGETYRYVSPESDLADGASGDFASTEVGYRLNVSAVVSPTNTFSPGAVTRNKKNGTATLAFNLPNAGEFSGSGQGAQVASTGAVTSKAVPPGIATLLVKAKGKKKRKLNEKGKVKLNLAVTYTPTGGDPSTQSVKVKLKKRL